MGEFNMSVDLKSIGVSATQAVKPSKVMSVIATMSKPAYASGNTLHITALDAINALRSCDWCMCFLANNVGACEASVAAALLWMSAIYESEGLLCDWMFKIPVHEWATTTGELSDWARSTNRWHPFVKADAALWLRRVKTLAGKNLVEADWYEERQLVSRSLAPGTMEAIGGSRADFRSLVLEEIDVIAKDIADKERPLTYVQNYEDWWKTRLRWVSSGSSSERSSVHTKESSSDRANKKAVADQMKWEDVAQTLAFKRKNRYRCSTKHELGFKNRALLAQDDYSYLVAAHSSNGIETNVKIGGVVCRQTPYDTAEWIREVNRLGTTETPILCADYSAFDRQHDPVFRAVLNSGIARQRARIHSGSDNPAWLQMSQSAYRVAWGHLNSEVDWPMGAEKLIRGLGSGDRDTARDNGFLHLAYHRVIFRLVQEAVPGAKVLFFRACGDDEVMVVNSQAAADAYVQIAELIGFSLNPVKQLLSGHVAEFLQINTTGSSVAVQPLASCVAGAAYGNWYKPVVTWYESALQSIVDQCTNMWRRGLPQHIAAYICRKMLDARYRVYKDDRLVELEWASFYRNDYKGNLFTIDCRKEPMPKIEKFKPEKVVLAAGDDGVGDLITAHADSIKHLGSDAIGALTDMVARDSRVSLYKMKAAKHARDWVSNNWPRRTTDSRRIKLIEMPNKPEMHEFVMMSSRQDKRVLTSMKEAAARAGVPPELVGMYTIDELLDNGRPDAYSGFEWPDEDIRSGKDPKTIWLPAQLAAAC